ncbi:GGDEF domain-containing protein [Kineococcus xinjiangensis]|uniref:GGDEF domain-containing protein n=1 Tax=Kineococcus xinjiangensis TaxID=512762 RepID=UPI0013049D7F|nr:GGDEF domain-containing protein [Kineococcus xinjiangensis]
MPGQVDLVRCHQREIVRSARVLCIGLTALYLFYLGGGVVGAWRTGAPLLTVVNCWLAGTAAVMAASGWIVTRFGARMGRWVHAATTAVGLVPIYNSAALLEMTQDPVQSVNLLLCITAMGLFVLSVPWYAALVAAAWAGWLRVALFAPADAAWEVFAYAMVAATVLSAVSLAVRRRMIRGMEEMRAQHEGAALVDALTGVCNRRGLVALLPRFLRRVGVGTVTVVAVDIDDMKGVNDTHGHAAGDAAVVGAADVLRRSLRPTDLIARTGGDEFVALVEAPDGGPVAERIRAELAAHADTASHPFRLRMSVGIATLPATAGLEEMLAAADAALYEVKATRRGVPGAA